MLARSQPVTLFYFAALVSLCSGSDMDSEHTEQEEARCLINEAMAQTASLLPLPLYLRLWGDLAKHHCPISAVSIPELRP